MNTMQQCVTAIKGMIKTLLDPETTIRTTILPFGTPAIQKRICVRQEKRMVPLMLT
jgi:hypothetical protein